MTLTSLVCGLLYTLSITFNVGADSEFRCLKVRKTPTTISQDDLHDVLREAHTDVFGHEPSLNRSTMAWAQVAFENGRGKKVFNHNLGNIGGNPIRPKLPFFMISGHRFRAFTSFEQGAQSYWETILKMCSGVLPAFDAGDPVLAAHVLRRCGYYRVDVEHYSENLSSLFFERQKNVQGAVQ